MTRHQFLDSLKANTFSRPCTCCAAVCRRHGRHCVAGDACSSCGVCAQRRGAASCRSGCHGVGRPAGSAFEEEGVSVAILPACSASASPALPGAAAPSAAEAIAVTTTRLWTSFLRRSELYAAPACYRCTAKKRSRGASACVQMCSSNRWQLPTLARSRRWQHYDALSSRGSVCQCLAMLSKRRAFAAT